MLTTLENWLRALRARFGREHLKKDSALLGGKPPVPANNSTTSGAGRILVDSPEPGGQGKDQPIFDAKTRGLLDLTPVLPGGNPGLVNEFFGAVCKLRPAVFCDIGANRGEASLRAKQLLPTTIVHAFEANPKIHAAFSEAPTSMGIGWHNLAVTGEAGPVDFYVPRRLSKVFVDGRIVDREHHEDEHTGKGSLLQRDEDAEYDHHIVQGITLDSFLAQHAPTGDVALWIDVEGAASLVLAGAAQALARTQILFVEVEGHKFWKGQAGVADIVQTLIGAGFVPALRDREYGDFQFNLLFARRELADELWPSRI